jgi:hypothetical protein
MKTILPTILGLILASAIYFGIAATITGPAGESLSTPIVTNAVSGSATTILTNRVGDPAGYTLVRTLQNVGTVAVLYALGTNASTSSYHGILRGGTTNRDGTGGTVDLSHWRGLVTIITEGGTGTVSATELLKSK